MRNTLVTACLCLSALMTSGGYLAGQINAEPVRANVIAANQPCNWRTCRKSKPDRISVRDKSSLTMKISALTQERMR